MKIVSVNEPWLETKEGLLSILPAMLSSVLFAWHVWSDTSSRLSRWGMAEESPLPIGQPKVKAYHRVVYILSNYHLFQKCSFELTRYPRRYFSSVCRIILTLATSLRKPFLYRSHCLIHELYLTNHHSSQEHATYGTSCLLLAFLSPTTCHLSNLM